MATSQTPQSLIVSQMKFMNNEIRAKMIWIKQLSACLPLKQPKKTRIFLKLKVMLSMIVTAMILIKL